MNLRISALLCRSTAAAVMIGAGLAAACPTVRAQDDPAAAGAPDGSAYGNAGLLPGQAGVDAVAKARLGQLLNAYRNLKSYSDHMEVRRKTPDGTMTDAGDIAYAAPGKARISYSQFGGRSVYVANGPDLYGYLPDLPGEYMRQEHLTDNIGVGAAFQLSNATGSGLVYLLIAGVNPLADILSGSTAIRSAHTGAIGGVDTDGVSIYSPPSENQPVSVVTIAMGHEDHLVRQVTISTIGETEPDLVETRTGVQANGKIPDSTFAYTPAAGDLKLVGLPTPGFRKDIKLGAKLVPFTSRDLHQKPVSPDQFKGKVLLVDFWATWCGPCKADLPFLAAAYRKYHAKGFEVLGISLDEANGPAPVSRAGVASFARGHGMTWPIAYDDAGFKKGVPKLYGVIGIPFTVLVDKKGLIRAVGLHGPDLDTLVAKLVRE